MKVSNRKEPWLLLLGDIFTFIISLWLALFIRFRALPSGSAFQEHLWPFIILFIIWSLIFFIAGLYEKHTLFFKRNLSLRVFNAQIFNSFLAIVFFYFIPYFGITPKIILFIYIIICSLFIFIWRLYGQNIFTWPSKDKAIIFGQEPELSDLLREVNHNPRYGLELVRAFNVTDLASVNFLAEISSLVKAENVSVIIIDLDNDNLKNNFPNFYNLLFSQIRFMDINILYEDIFDRIPLTLINYDWFLRNISLANNIIYDVIKRITDIIISAVLGLLSLVFYPIIYLGIKIDDQGKIFIVQDRVGKNNKLISIIKFRTMTFNDNENNNKEKNKVTRFGSFLRKSRLDELPQLWNVLCGDLSLIGPRPELPALVNIYEKDVPYYRVRHLIKPGLSGWAQLYHKNHPHQGLNTEETKNKLSYDLFYIKNRSLLLDLQIILKTIKTILLQTGR